MEEEGNRIEYIGVGVMRRRSLTVWPMIGLHGHEVNNLRL